MHLEKKLDIWYKNETFFEQQKCLLPPAASVPINTKIRIQSESVYVKLTLKFTVFKSAAK